MARRSPCLQSLRISITTHVRDDERLDVLKGRRARQCQRRDRGDVGLAAPLQCHHDQRQAGNDADLRQDPHYERAVQDKEELPGWWLFANDHWNASSSINYPFCDSGVSIALIVSADELSLGVPIRRIDEALDIAAGT